MKALNLNPRKMAQEIWPLYPKVDKKRQKEEKRKRLIYVVETSFTRF